MLKGWSRKRRARRPLSDSEFVGRFQRRSTAPADHRRTVPASERIADFFRAVRAVKRPGAGLRRRILRACRHEEENCSTEAALASVKLRELHWARGGGRLPIVRKEAQSAIVTS